MRPPYTALAMNVLDHLWTGWRVGYVRAASAERSGAATGASVFTEILATGLPDTETNIVWRGPTCFVIMNAFPYTSGHVLVLPYREVADLDDLSADEHTELWATVRHAAGALRRAYKPHGLNIGVNLGAPSGGSIDDHLHVHVVPRWTGDSNFMTTIANTRTLPEPIGDSAARVRAAWGADVR